MTRLSRTLKDSPPATGVGITDPSWWRRWRQVKGLSLGLRFRCAHCRDLVNLATAIIGDPLAHLDAVLEVTRSHPRAIKPKPFPISVGRAVEHVALSVDGAVFVVLDVSLSHSLKDSTPLTRSPVARRFGATSHARTIYHSSRERSAHIDQRWVASAVAPSVTLDRRHRLLEMIKPGIIPGFLGVSGGI